MASPSVGAAVDVGSTSVHLVVAGVLGNVLEPLHDESAFLGLGAVVDERGCLGTAVTAELVAALQAFAEHARSLGAAGLTVVATEPLRRALDASRVVRAVEREAGIAVHVVSHDEEALLTLLGVTAGAPPDGNLVVVDIGGGSTEIVVPGPGGRPATVGLPLGAARLTARFAATDPPTPSEFGAMLDRARSGVAAGPAVESADIVAVGGTADNVLKVASHGVVGAELRLTREDLGLARSIMLSAPSIALATAYRVKPLRARLLPAGVAILLAVLERYDAESLRISSAGVREGAILAVARAGIGWRDRLAELATGATPPDPVAGETADPRPLATTVRPTA